MATLEQLSAALIKADAAGNIEDAKTFADAIRQLKNAQPEISEPKRGIDRIPGAGGDIAPAAQPSEVPFGRRVIETLRPASEAAGAALGAQRGAQIGTMFAPALGPFAPAAPIIGGVLGGGLGYATAKTSLDVPEQQLGYQPRPTSVSNAFVRAGEDVATGAALEALGQGVIAPVIGKGAAYFGKIKDLKLDTYLNALEGKGDDILNALRGARSSVAGAAPGAGEVASPAGSVGFSALQARAEKIPALAPEYARMEAQTAAAQTAQQARAQAKFDAAAAKVQSRMNSTLQPMRPEDAGAALVAGAEAKREALKKSVIEPAYAAAFKEAGDAKIDLTKVIGEAESILGRTLSDFDPSTAPETVRKLLALQPKAPLPKPIGAGVVSSKIKQAPPSAPTPEVTLQQLDDIRKAVNADIAAGKTSLDPGAGMRLRNLSKIHQAIDDAVKTSVTLPDTAKTAYRDALDLYRTEYIPRFKTGVNDQLFRATGLNEPKIKPEDVITKYFQPRGVSEAKNFVTLFGKDPKAMQVARSGIEDLYVREIKDVTPEAHAAFLRKYADPIKVLDDAGMNVLQRINVVGTNAARLQKINDLAAKTSIKLRPSLPPGATADAVERQLEMLTKNLSPQQLSHVNAVQQDLLRRGEYDRLVKASADTGVNIKQLGTTAGREAGVPLPSFLSVPITVFNNVVKRLALRLDDKLAMEIAREMTDPALAAKSVEQALRQQRTSQITSRVAPAAARAITTGVGVNALAPEQQPVNALAP